MDSTGFIGNQYWLWITFFTESHQCQRSLKCDSNLSRVWTNDYNKIFSSQVRFLQNVSIQSPDLFQLMVLMLMEGHSGQCGDKVDICRKNFDLLFGLLTPFFYN